LFGRLNKDSWVRIAFICFHVLLQETCITK
jgi:hypothetical protein